MSPVEMSHAEFLNITLDGPPESAHPTYMAHKKNPTPSLAQIRVAAAHAGCDPRTLLRLLAGQPVRGIAGERALAALKLIPPT